LATYTSPGRSTKSSIEPIDASAMMSSLSVAAGL
jgi:hypothetical protein